MRVIEVSGSPQQLGEATGEALRQEIRQHIEVFPMRQWEPFEARLPLFLEGLERHLPDVLVELRATARGAAVEEHEILRLNLPLFPGDLDHAGDPPVAASGTAPGDGCTNFAFVGGADGPVWSRATASSRAPSTCSSAAAWAAAATSSGAPS